MITSRFATPARVGYKIRQRLKFSNGMLAKVAKPSLRPMERSKSRWNHSIFQWNALNLVDSTATTVGIDSTKFRALNYSMEWSKFRRFHSIDRRNHSNHIFDFFSTLIAPNDVPFLYFLMPQINKIYFKS